MFLSDGALSKCQEYCELRIGSGVEGKELGLFLGNTPEF
jgi:hypothetical protein